MTVPHTGRLYTEAVTVRITPLHQLTHSYGLRASEFLRQAQDQSNLYTTGPKAHHSLQECMYGTTSFDPHSNLKQRLVYAQFTDEETALREVSVACQGAHDV